MAYVSTRRDFWPTATATNAAGGVDEDAGGFAAVEKEWPESVAQRACQTLERWRVGVVAAVQARQH
eukprot:10184830-Lingulodinium_polyedra.AAC.1